MLFDELNFCLQRLYSIPFHVEMPFNDSILEEITTAEASHVIVGDAVVVDVVDIVVVVVVVDDVVIDVVVVDVADVVDVIVGDLSPEQPRRESLLESK